MYSIYACLTEEHELGLVVLAGFICLLASYTAVSLIGRGASARGAARMAWLAGTAVVAGSGIWATHFLAMLAYRPGFPVAFDLSVTLLSLAIAIAVTGIGFTVATLQSFLRQLAVPAGGVIVGLGIFAMHYSGMAAVRIPGHIDYDGPLVAASLLISTGLAACALRVALAGEALRYRFLGGGLLALAILGLHFTAMGAAQPTPSPLVPLPERTMEQETLAAGLAVITVLILSTGFVGSVVDQRFAALARREAERLRKTVAELQRTKAHLEKTTRDLSLALSAAAAGSQSKSRFLATMSHELRTPLNAVIGFSEMLSLEAHGPLTARQRAYVGDIRDSGAHLLDLVNDLLDLSKLDADCLTLDEDPLDLGELVVGAMEMISPRALDVGVSLEREIPAGLPLIRADHRRVRQVLLNLLSNAVKFTTTGGHVRVAVYRSAAGLSVVIADDGIGMAPEDVPKALERFGQIDGGLARRYEGTGLGLPLSKQLMELHAGTLEIDSALGVGTRVTITFPNERVIAAQRPSLRAAS